MTDVIKHPASDVRAAIPADRPTLATWQEAPHNRWAFTHVDEIVPTVAIPREPVASDDVSVSMGTIGAVPDIAQRLDDTYTDALVVSTSAGIVGEWYRAGVTPQSRHLLMSVSKSICGMTVGALIDAGAIDPSRRIDTYIPELTESAYGDATVQHVLDMTVDVDYDEDYRNPDSHVRMQDRIAGWLPRRDDDPVDGYEFLATLRGGGAHGEQFRYCSAGTDVLAWLVEKVSGQRYAEAVSELVWSRIGVADDALITVDRSGFAFANGGVACTARDMIRVGMVMLHGGVVDGRRVLSEEWVRQTSEGGDPDAAAGSILQNIHPRGSYANQWWHTGSDRGEYYAVGIHGQYIWIDPSRDVVIAKFSSWPDAISERWNRVHAELFRALAAAAVAE